MIAIAQKTIALVELIQHSSLKYGNLLAKDHINLLVCRSNWKKRRLNTPRR
jgi:hypothetical protein